LTKARDLASGGFGLVLVKPSSVVNGTDNGKGTVSFNGTSIQLNGVFNSTYDNYKIEFSMPVASTSGSVAYQLCTNGSANTTSNYSNATWAFRSGNGQLVDTANESNTTSAVFSALGTGNAITLNLYNPFSSSYKTFINGVGVNISDGAGYLAVAMIHGSRFNATTSFDGIKFNFGSNAQVGTISVYGINK
jgi:hypothetical protein